MIKRILVLPRKKRKAVMAALNTRNENQLKTRNNSIVTQRTKRYQV